MKIYVSCDIEGLAGIATFDMEKEDTVLFRDYITNMWLG